MRGCSLFLDDRPIIVDGDMVVDELRPGGMLMPA
jgi:2,5-dihydroxypyridine 5,6-dioxygenase